MARRALLRLRRHRDLVSLLKYNMTVIREIRQECPEMNVVVDYLA